MKRFVAEANPRSGSGAMPLRWLEGIREGVLWPRSNKRNLLQLLLVMVLGMVGVLLAATPVSGQLEVVGGATYNTYSLDWGAAVPEHSYLIFNSGWGYYGGVQYWVNPLLAIGGQVDAFTGSGQERWVLGDGTSEVVLAIHGQGTGYLATLAAPIAAQGIVEVTPFVAAGAYRVAADMTVSGQGGNGTPGEVTAKGRLTSPSCLGGKFGVTIAKEIAPGLSPSGQFAYRLVPAFRDLRVEVFGFEQEWVVDEGINVSGLSAGVAFTYRF